jgi:uncharacterized repeat protein (TIGR03803 family)
LHAFRGPDGNIPYGVVMDSTGSLYGMTQNGGKDNFGVVFKLSQSGGHWKVAVLHSFHGKDGLYPFATMTFDQQGMLYGSTPFGGRQYNGQNLGYGVVFSIAP